MSKTIVNIMADSFDNLVFSSSLIIFITALIFIFSYEFLLVKGDRNKVENISTTGKVGRKTSKTKNKSQFDKFE
ncbi:MAG: hypothetical protein M3Y25_03705 [Thermoproteota archaeon]|nr:hypothetical protein [Thermoproteota archaeon]